MAQGFSITLVGAKDVDFPAQLMRAVAWEAKRHLEEKYPSLGDVEVSLFDTTDFDYGRGVGKEGQ